MSDLHFAPITLQPSRRLAVILTAVHAAVIGLLWLLPVPAWMLVVMTALLLASTGYSVFRYALLRGNHAIAALAFSDRTTAQIGLRDGSWHAGQVLGTSTVTAALTVLNIKLQNRRMPAHVVMMGDSLDAGDFRRLRVWLRWGPRVSGEGA